MAVLVGVLAAPGLSRAQEELPTPDRSHIYIGVRGTGLAMAAEPGTRDDDLLAFGGGMGLFLGLQVGPIASLEFNWITNWTEEAVFWRVLERNQILGTTERLSQMTFTGDLKLRVPTDTGARPFLLVGGGYAFVGADLPGFDDALLASGPTFQVGAGLDVWLSPWFTIGGQVYYRGLYLEDEMTGDDVDYGTTEFDLNLALHF